MTPRSSPWRSLALTAVIYGTATAAGSGYGWAVNRFNLPEAFPLCAMLGLLCLLIGGGVALVPRSDPVQRRVGAVCVAAFLYGACLGCANMTPPGSTLLARAAWGLTLVPFGIVIWFLVASRAWIGTVGSALIVFAGCGVVTYGFAGHRGYGLIVRILY